VIAHSMGGLDTRAYIEGLAVWFFKAQCKDDGLGGDLFGGYSACEAFKEPCGNDIAQLITLDTPTAGRPLQRLGMWSIFLTIFLTNAILRCR